MKQEAQTNNVEFEAQEEEEESSEEVQGPGGLAGLITSLSGVGTLIGL